ncbi:MAG: SMC-Scp complex subunit ScpB [Spirochaeta sp.]|nr:SMC-Scp complex subunit ScpB [Spirochaeta sp.]
MEAFTEAYKAANLIESILYLENQALGLPQLIRKTGLTHKIVSAAIEIIRKEYDSEIHGLELIQIGDDYTFAPKQALWEHLKPLYGKKHQGRLSKAALVTMAIIAYSQPITRAEIESIRGVAADGMIRLLLSKGLIKEVGKKDSPGRPIQFGTTKEFLKYFRLGSIADLPRLEDREQDRFESNG